MAHDYYPDLNEARTLSEKLTAKHPKLHREAAVLKTMADELQKLRTNPPSPVAAAPTAGEVKGRLGA